MNRKNILVTLLVLLAVSGISLTVYYFKFKDDKNSNKNEDGETNMEVAKVILNDLYDYGKELYENNEYLNLPKDEDGIYSVKLSMLKESGYDISTLVNNGCDLNDKIILFDIDKTKYDDEVDIPMHIDMDCLKIEVNNLNDTQKTVYDLLFKYASDLYDNEKYTEFDRDEKDMYYINIASLDKYGYDISYISKNCRIDDMKIFFNSDINIDESSTPFYFTINC